MARHPTPGDVQPATLRVGELLGVDGARPNLANALAVSNNPPGIAVRGLRSGELTEVALEHAEELDRAWDSPRLAPDDPLVIACDRVGALLGRAIRVMWRHHPDPSEQPFPAVATASGGRFVIAQRCLACGAQLEIDARVVRANVDAKGEHVVIGVHSSETEESRAIALMGEIGPLVRKAWQRHRCEPVETALAGFTNIELEELFTMLENDADRAMKRAGQIQKLIRDRGP